MHCLRLNFNSKQTNEMLYRLRKKGFENEYAKTRECV